MKNTDFEVESLSGQSENVDLRESPGYMMLYVLYGIIFGIILYKAEIVNWFRIQEMFRFQSFHMYGVIGSAVITGMIAVWVIKRFRVKTFGGQPVTFTPKSFSKGQIIGGFLFGMGWAITGACPGPLFIQIGAGYGIVAITLLCAILGTWMYGRLRNKLPH